MELWIRNQNREVLAKIHSISIEVKTSTKFSIVGNDEWRLGIYETEKRALEVLDEIQSIMCFKRLEKYSGFGTINVENNIAVYEMPKE